MKWLLLPLFAAALISVPPAAAGAPRVLAIHFSSDVNPVSERWVDDQLHRAASGGYAAAVIVLDTPGGLEDSMRRIVAAELASPVPVVVYVAPGGARAASAGVWISQAADVLAMAPQTNIGSSTPIQGNGQNIGSDLRRKSVNDAAASLRGLAAAHHRNAAWADRAVRVASNLTASEALRRNVIDLIAPSLPTLLDRIDGRRSAARPLTLHTAHAQVVDVHPGFATRLLSALIDPNVVSLLFLAGLAGLGFELFHPGVVIPGAFGAICLLVALFGFAVLPLSWSGLALVLLGVALLVTDAFVASHGALTLSGLVALALGLVTLFHDDGTPYHTSVPLIVSVTVAIGGLWAFAMAKAIAIRRAPVAMGPQLIVGREGVARGGGYVFVAGELWRARADEELAPGDPVRVVAVDGLSLEVRRT